MTIKWYRNANLRYWCCLHHVSFRSWKNVDYFINYFRTCSLFKNYYCPLSYFTNYKLVGDRKSSISDNSARAVIEVGSFSMVLLLSLTTPYLVVSLQLMECVRGQTRNSIQTFFPNRLSVHILRKWIFFVCNFLSLQFAFIFIIVAPNF